MVLLPVLKDNTIVDHTIANHSIVKGLVNRDLAQLEQENFIVFPQSLSQSLDLTCDNYIFQESNGIVRTCNVVGVLSNQSDELKIVSRFSSTNNYDFFLRYMIETVFNYNIIDLFVQSSDEGSYHDLLIHLFPFYLNEAMTKGLYKEYVKHEYNDTNVKGTVDVSRHIKMNTPFRGDIAYRTREFSHNNPVVELIRHTIEKIERDRNYVLDRDEATRRNVRIIKENTRGYSHYNIHKVIKINMENPLKHGYFEAYSQLQKLCLRILKEDQVGFGIDCSEIHGIIIDVAWLWEEYIAKITKWKRYGRQLEFDNMKMFEKLYLEKQQHRYPDFVVNNVPIDTKYKRNLDKRNDYNQITTYIHIMNAESASFLQPTDTQYIDPKIHLGTLYGGGDIYTYMFFIPQNADSYETFCKEIHTSELTLLTFRNHFL